MKNISGKILVEIAVGINCHHLLKQDRMKEHNQRKRRRKEQKDVELL
jgi:hypothetical protein